MGPGMAVIAGGLGLMSLLADGTTYWPVLASAALLGAGIDFAATPATDAIVAALPPAKQGIASAVNDLTRELGGVLGIAVLGSVFNTVYRTEIGAAPQTAARDSLAAALRVADERGGRTGDDLAAAARDAFGAGMTSALLVGGAVVIAGGLAAMLLLPRHGAERGTDRAGRPVA